MARSRLLTIFIPSKYEVASLLAIAAAALFMINSLSITNLYGNGEVISTDYFQTTVDKIVEPLSGETGKKFVTLFIWGVIGMLVYLLCWGTATIAHAYKNDIPPLSGFMVPQGYAKTNTWQTILARLLIRFIATVLVFVWFYLFFSKVLPYASELFLGTFVDFNLMKLLNAGLSIIVTAAGLFMFNVFLRCMFLRTRVFPSPA